MATTTLSRRQKAGLNVRLIGGLALIVVAIAVALVLARPSGSAAQIPATVPVTRGNIVGSVSGSGTVTAEQSVDLSFQTTGVVTQVFAQEGDAVKEGQALAKLDDRSLQADVTNDQAALASAQMAYTAAVADASTGDTTLASLKVALDKALVSLQQAQAAYDKVAGRSDVGMTQQAVDLQKATIDYQKAKYDYETQAKTSGPDSKSKIASASASLTQAEQALKKAQINLDNATLRAPFGGIITAVNIVPGSDAAGTTAAVSLIDRNPLHVNLKLSENDVVKVQLNQPVTLTIDSLSDWQAPGTVSYIASAAQTSNGVVTYVVRVQFDDSDARVKVGMTANLNIVTAQKNNVLLVPNAALLPKGSGHVVQVVDKNGKTTEVEVQTGLTDGTQTEIVSGLNEGMHIVALPSSNTPKSGGLFGG